MDTTVLNVALPAITAQLQPSSVQILWMVDVYALVVAGFLVVASEIADRIGRRRMLIAGYAVFATAPILVIFANSAADLITIRALLGIGGALIMPSTLSLIRTLFHDPRERAFALGIWGSMAAVGAGMGPLVGGLLVQHLSWHWAFLFNTPIMIVALIAACKFLPESKVPGKGRWDALGVALSVIGIAAMVYAIKDMARNGFGQPLTWIVAIVAAVALTWFVLRSLRMLRPVLDLRLLRYKGLSAGLVTAIVSSVGVASMMLLIAQWLQLVKGYTPVQAGVQLLPMAITACIFSPLAPKMAEMIGVRTVIVGGLSSGGLGFTLLWLAPSPFSSLTLFVSLMLVGLSMSSLAVGSAIIMGSAPLDRVGNAAAMEEIAFKLGGVLGVTVLGSLAATLYRWNLPRGDLMAMGINGSEATAAQDSLGGAASVAESMDEGGAAMLNQAQEAFTASVSTAGLVGGLLMFMAAALVWRMIPRHQSIAGVEH
ncbi:MFS transporter [Natronoglycomyces albus]|uniref:MFS transporter n=2 Tax=Natronoglycomyces albus TaxID=2811108 RepID=A0A895XTL6_9ACTN|nr:MFS transporter [Natronoglycomyces albus]